MNYKISDSLINLFISEVETKNASLERIKLKKNKLARRQILLTNTLNAELIKYNSVGFTFSYSEKEIVIPCFTEDNDTFDFSVNAFTIEYSERNLKFTFTPCVDVNGSISYRYERVEGEHPVYGDKLIWKEDLNAWYFNAAGQRLKAMVFDGDCIIMILTNMSYII